MVAALWHPATLWAQEMARAAEGLPAGRDRITAVLDLLAAQHTGPLFAAALEVWVAPRSDAALRAALQPVEANLGREVHRRTVEMLGADESRPGVREAIQATLDLMRGLGVNPERITRPRTPTASPATPWPRVPRTRVTGRCGTCRSARTRASPIRWRRPPSRWSWLRTIRIAAISQEMILNFVAQHTLGLPRSY